MIAVAVESAADRPVPSPVRHGDLAVPTSAAWFWTEERRRREREVDAHVVADEVTLFDDVEDFLHHLDSLG